MSLNLNGDMGKNLFYSVNMYQDFDPGTFKIKSTPYQDRTLSGSPSPFDGSKIETFSLSQMSRAKLA